MAKKEIKKKYNVFTDKHEQFVYEDGKEVGKITHSRDSGLFNSDEDNVSYYDSRSDETIVHDSPGDVFKQGKSNVYETTAYGGRGEKTGEVVKETSNFPLGAKKTVMKDSKRSSSGSSSSSVKKSYSGGGDSGGSSYSGGWSKNVYEQGYFSLRVNSIGALVAGSIVGFIGAVVAGFCVGVPVMLVLSVPAAFLEAIAPGNELTDIAEKVLSLLGLEHSYPYH